MQIVNIYIKNFRSLRDVQLNDLDDLNIFVGKNSSGKSNLVEALCLFFNDFAVAGGNTPGLTEYHWFNKKQKNPIEFQIDIKLSEKEVTEIFSPDFFKPIKKFLNKPYLLRVNRKIINSQGTWYTKALAVSGLLLVKDDKATTPKEAVEFLAIEYLKNLRKTATERAVSIPTLSPDQFSKVLSNISLAIKGKFKLISQIRDVKNPIVNRVTLIDSELQNALWNLDQSIKSEEEQKCTEIESAFTSITGKRIDPAQGQLYIRRQGRRFPLNLEGGGIQASIQLVFSLKNEKEKYLFFGIEEPEAHSHPELQRNLFNELTSFANERQLFVTTHSPTFVDRTDLTKVWVSKFMNNETLIKRAGELKEIVTELGIRPSDVIFFANKILFVEGKSEVIVIPVMAENLGVNLTDIAIIPVEGKNKARLNLRTWIEITRGILPLFLLLDNDAEKELEELKKEGLIESGQYHIWKAGAIESYYPLRLLEKALNQLNERYSLEMDVPAVMKNIREQTLMPDKIDLGNKAKLLDKSWEVLLAESMAKLLIKEKQEPISEEVSSALKTAVGVA